MASKFNAFSGAVGRLIWIYIPK